MRSEIFSIFSVLLAILILGTGINFFQLQKSPDSTSYHEIRTRIYSWWIIFIVGLIAFLTAPWGLALIFAIVSTLGLHEILRVVRSRNQYSNLISLFYTAPIIQFYFATRADSLVPFVLIPLVAYLVVPAFSVFLRSPANFLGHLSSIQWTLMVPVYCLGHFLFLSGGAHPSDYFNPVTALIVLVLTQLNDVLQFIWGKLLGKAKIIPNMSPNKTWAGFLGGVFSLAILSSIILPKILPISPALGLLFGALLSGGGFVGDVVLSAVKRDFGVKDFSSIIPGHGGIMDRFDSLTFTAPLAYYFLKIVLTS